MKINRVILVIIIILPVLISGCIGSNNSSQTNTTINTATTQITTQTTSTQHQTTHTTTTTTNKQEHKILTQKIYSDNSIQIYWRGYDRDKWVLNKIKVRDLFTLQIAPGRMYTVIDTGVILDNVKIVPKVNIISIGKLGYSNIEAIVPSDKLSAFNMYLVKGESTVFLGMFIIKPIKPIVPPKPTITSVSVNVTPGAESGYNIKISMTLKVKHLPLLTYHYEYSGNYNDKIQYDITTNQLSGTSKVLIEFDGDENTIKSWNPVISYSVFPEDSTIFNLKHPLYSGRITLTSVKSEILEKIDELNNTEENNNTQENNQTNTTPVYNNSTEGVLKAGNFTLYYYKSCNKGAVYVRYTSNITANNGDNLTIHVAVAGISKGFGNVHTHVVSTNKVSLKLFSGDNVIDQILPVKVYYLEDDWDEYNWFIVMTVKKNGQVISKQSIPISQMKPLTVATCNLSMTSNKIHYKLQLSDGIDVKEIISMLNNAVIIKGVLHSSTPVEGLFNLMSSTPVYFDINGTHYHIRTLDTLLRLLKKYNVIQLSDYNNDNVVTLKLTDENELNNLISLLNSTRIVYFKFSLGDFKPPYYAFVNIYFETPSTQSVQISSSNTKIIKGVFEYFVYNNEKYVEGVALTTLDDDRTLEFIMTIPKDMRNAMRSITVNVASTTPVAPFIQFVF